jgi:hypothetical protein
VDVDLIPDFPDDSAVSDSGCAFSLENPTFPTTTCRNGRGTQWVKAKTTPYESISGGVFEGKIVVTAPSGGLDHLLKSLPWPQGAFIWERSV